MLGRFATSFRVMRLFSRSTMRFSTGPGQQAPSFKLPLRWEITGDAHDEMRTWVNASTSCDMIANLLKDNVKFVTDGWLAAMYEHMAYYDFELDKSFYEVIVPITKEYLKVYARDNTSSLSTIALSSASLKVDDKELWNLIFKKLYDDKLHRYLSLANVAQLYALLIKNNIQVGHPLLEVLQRTMAQQSAFYSHYPELQAIINQATDKYNIVAPKKPEQPRLQQSEKVDSSTSSKH